MDQDINLGELDEKQLLEGLGDVVFALLRDNGAALIVSREDGAITFLNPLLLSEIPPERMAEALLGTWEEDSVELFLKRLYG